MRFNLQWSVLPSLQRMPTCGTYKRRLPININSVRLWSQRSQLEGQFLRAIRPELILAILVQLLERVHVDLMISESIIGLG